MRQGSALCLLVYNPRVSAKMALSAEEAADFDRRMKEMRETFRAVMAERDIVFKNLDEFKARHKSNHEDFMSLFCARLYSQLLLCTAAQLCFADSFSTTGIAVKGRKTKRTHQETRKPTHQETRKSRRKT